MKILSSLAVGAALTVSLTGLNTTPLASTIAARCAPPSAQYSPGATDATAPTDLIRPPADVVELTPTQTKAAAATVGATTIQTWFHIITNGPGTDVTDDQVSQQLAVMNDAFAAAQGGASSPFSFALAGTDRTENAQWYGALAPGSAEETAMKTALHQGGATTLNVYVTKTSGSSWGRFPSSYRFAPALDGIVVTKGHFLGTADTYSSESSDVALGVGLGDIAVHETGHWLGLYHTFQGYDAATGTGGCAEGDLVDDTPSEDVPSSGCPLLADTCIAPGTDPIHNFMDYSNELCMSEFTAGQVERMKAQWSTYRLATPKPGKANGKR